MIDAYDFGWIVIDGRTYTNDLIIFPDRIEAEWWRREGHALHIEDIESIVAAKPELLIVGTGKYGVLKVPAQTRAYLHANGIDLLVEPTDKAVELYNYYAGAKKVVAALHLTC
jgi:hypothetical protein